MAVPATLRQDQGDAAQSWHMRRSEHIRLFTETMWAWFARHKRLLPWRDLRIADDTDRAYRILVSEIMLQQTQVERVKVIYERFLHQFPTLLDLAAATNSSVILAWRGLGYNNRALRLRDAARHIIERHSDSFPHEMQALESITGIGPYTAAAIRNFAFNLPTPCIDTNIRRILHRTFVGPERPDGTWKKDDRYLLDIAEEVLEVALAASPPRPPPPLRPTPIRLRSFGASARQAGEGGVPFVQRQAPPLPGRAEWQGRGGQGGEARFPHDARNWHAALMDFGSLVQTKKNPQWEMCPLTRRGLMKTKKRLFERSQDRRSKLTAHSSKLREPGREIVGRFIPDRIMRGRLVEALRDAPSGLSVDALGRRVAADWSLVRHRHWLQQLLEKLSQEKLVARRGATYVLHE